jgi:hypothetical protein
MEYLSEEEINAISNLYGVTRKLLSDYPIELALVYKEILGEEINPSELDVSENAALLFRCLYLYEGSYSETFNILNESIADNSANDPSIKLYGCTDASAENYNPEATEDDGGCIINGSRSNRSICNDINATNYGEYAPQGCQYDSGGGGGYGCQCEYYSYDTEDPCYDECYYEPGGGSDNQFCYDSTASNYGEQAECEYNSGSGLLNSLSAIGNALWGVVESIGLDVIYNDIMGNDSGSTNSSNNNNNNAGCSGGLVSCTKNGISGCHAAIDCDKDEEEKSYTWLYITLGVLAIGGVGYLIYKNKK